MQLALFLLKIPMKIVQCIHKVITLKLWLMMTKMKLLKNFLNHFFESVESVYKQQREALILSLIVLIYCITNVIKQTRWFIYWFSGLVKKEKSNNKSEKYFQYGATIMLDKEKIGNNPQRIRKIHPFTNNYTWYEIIFYRKNMIG